MSYRFRPDPPLLMFTCIHVSIFLYFLVSLSNKLRWFSTIHCPHTNHCDMFDTWCLVPLFSSPPHQRSGIEHSIEAEISRSFFGQISFHVSELDQKLFEISDGLAALMH